MLYVLYSIHAEKGNEILMIEDSGFNRFRWRLRRDPSTQVAAVLAFVISHTTFLAAQDDETGRCPKVVCKSLVLRFPNHWHVSQLPNQVRSEE